MSENWGRLGLYSVPSSATEYERLGAAIEELQPRVTAGSTLQDDLNALRVARRRLWMRRNGLGPL